MTTWNAYGEGPAYLANLLYFYTQSLAPPPSITSVSPSSYPSSANSLPMTIYGNNFQSGATLTFVDPQGTSIPSTAGKLTVVSSSQINYQFNDGNDSGNWTVQVNNPDGQSSVPATGFSVTQPVPPPSITSVSPSSYPSSANSLPMTIYGNNFQSGATLTFVDPQGTSIPSTASKLTVVSSSQINYQFNDGNDPGNWTVQVNNPDGQSSVPATGFSVTQVVPPPSISSVSPSSYPSSANSLPMTIYGNNFQSGATLTFVDPQGTSIPSTAGKLTVVSSSQINYQFNDGNDPGNWTVQVNNPDGQSSVPATGFSVTQVVPPPSISSVSPSSYPSSANNQSMTIYGNNFQSGATLTFVDPQGTSIPSTAGKLTVVSSSQISYQFNDGNDSGNWTVQVNNPDGQSSVPATGFSVTQVAPPPSITSVSPSSYPFSASSLPMTIYGNNFQSGATLTFVDPQGTSIPSTASKLTVVSSSQINYQFNDGNDPGNWTVQVNNPDGQSSVPATGFSVTSGASLIVVSPNGGQNWTAGTAQTVSWSVTGTPASPISYFGMNYSLDSGSTWVQNGYFANGSSSFGSWTLPSTVASTHARVQIIAVNSSGLAMFWGESAGDFTIAPPTGNPVAVATCDNHAPAPGTAVTVNFNGSGSTGSSSSCGINAYAWTFGDGTSSSAANPSHTYYPAAGTSTVYPVNLTVTDCLGKVASASLNIYITGQALGNNPQQPFSLDPVNLATGNYTYNHTDLRIPGRGIPFEFKRYYNSKDTTSTGIPLGFGWTHSYNVYLTTNPTNGAVAIAFGDGHQELYTTNGVGGYSSGEPGVFNVLSSNGNSFMLTTKEQQLYSFNAQGQLMSVADKNGNSISLGYSGPDLTSITDSVGRVTALAYNVDHCLTNISDPIGRTIQFTYDANSNLVSVLDTRGGLTQFGYDQYHQMTNATDPRGVNFLSMVYDAQKRVVSSQKDALQASTTFTYDFVNGVTTVTDAMGNVSYNYYDSKLRMIKTVDNLGNVQTFQYDNNNDRTVVIDKNGSVTLYGYDGNGNVTSKTNALKNTTFIGYDALNNPTNRWDALSNLTAFVYDARGNLTATINALGQTNTVHCDPYGEPLVVTDANGHSTTNSYDAFGDLVQTQDALGDITRFHYDRVGRRIAQVDALDRTNLYFYDASDNLISSVDGLNHTNSFGFDGNNNRVTATDFNGNTSTNFYDEKNRLIVSRDPLGDCVTNVYDALDRKVRVIDARGNLTAYGYDLVGNLLTATNAIGGVTSYAYDPNGNRTRVTDPLGNVTTNVYDSLNRLVLTQDPLTNITKSIYDPLGRRLQSIDALGRTNSFVYDAMGRLTQFIDAAGGKVAYTYDSVGNRTSTTDPDGHTTTNLFDPLNRLQVTIDPDGGVMELHYDALGNLVRRTDPKGNLTLYQYDADNRRTDVIYPTGPSVLFGYDANGNRTRVSDGLGLTIYSYDALNRLTNVTDCYGQSVGYGYDPNGNRTSLAYPGSKSVSYGYDQLNRVANVTDWLGNTTLYFYDADGNLTNSINPNGTAAAYQYDAAGRLVFLTNSAAGTKTIAGYQYRLDAVGNHLQVNQTEQLPNFPVSGQFAYGYDNDNRLTNSEGQVQTFDANGNLTSFSATNFLAYDYENRLTLTAFGGNTNNYQYDGAGNRLSAKRAGTVTRYVLDRAGALAQVLVETDSSGNPTAYYVYGLGLVSRIDASGNARFYHFDSRGSTIAVTDPTGQTIEAYAYDPFGRQVNASPSISNNPFRYLGRHGVANEQDGLLYIRARYYSPQRGRFITKDPTTGKDGDTQGLNRYVYALNNPIRLVDISGLSAQEVSGSQIGLVTSDTLLLHNFLINPSSGGLDMQMAETTPSFVPQNGGSWLTFHGGVDVPALGGDLSVTVDTQGVKTITATGGELLWTFSVYHTSTGDNGGCWSPGLELDVAKVNLSACVGTDGVSLGADGGIGPATAGLSLPVEKVTSTLFNAQMWLGSTVANGYLSGINAAGNLLYQTTGF